jgi:cytoskeletal protein CcmA (bactofilin family)
MAKIIIKDSEISSSAGINIPGNLSIAGDTVIGDLFTDSLVINANTTFNEDINAEDIIISSSFKGDGSQLHSITASNISNFTNDVRAQFSAGTNITISNGVISSDGGAGGDPWTYIKRSSDFSTYLQDNVPVTGLSFFPSPNKVYEIEGRLLIRTNTNSSGPRPGIQWSNNVSDGASQISSPSSNTELTFRNQGARTTENAASTGLPTTSHSYLAIIHCLLVTNSNTAAIPWSITLASETGALAIIKANSFFRYREVS